MYDLLKGLRVVEGSAFVAAPLGGMTLAQLGADVIRFDALEGGLDSDRWPVTRDGVSLYWQGLNKGKRSIAVDLRSPRGRELLTALITAPGPDAGIFMTNLPARGWLAYEEFAKRRADLIMLTILGTRTGAPQVDYTVNAGVGFPLISGPEGHPRPVNQVIPAWDLATGMMAATGILAADRHRRMTGQGRLIKLPLQDVALATAGNLGYLAEAEVNGDERARYGNHIFGTFGQDFPTADGRYVMICIFTTRQLHALKDSAGLGEAFAAIESRMGVNLEDEGDRFRARDALTEAIAPWVARHTLAEIRPIFDKAGVLWGPYQSFKQLLAEDPVSTTDNPMFSRVTHPGTGTYLTPGTPLDFVGLDRRPQAPAPVLGQHTDEILAGVLGLPEREIGELHDAKVVAGPR